MQVPFFLTGVRMIVAGAILSLYLIFKNRKSLTLPLKALPLLFCLSLFNVFITNAFEFWGLQYMETAKTSLIYSLSPFAAIILSFIFLSEKMNLKKWAGLLIGIIGFLPILLSTSPSETKTASLGFFSLSEIAVSISAFTAVIGWIVMKKLMVRHRISYITANTYSFFGGGLMSLLTSAFVENWSPVPVDSWAIFIPSMLYIAVVHNVICYNIYAYSLNRFSISFMTFAGFVNPLFTAAYGWIFLDEKVGIAFFISLALIFLGIYVYSRAEKKKENVQSSET